jgi:hypothetical protein
MNILKIAADRRKRSQIKPMARGMPMKMIAAAIKIPFAISQAMKFSYVPIDMNYRRGTATSVCEVISNPALHGASGSHGPGKFFGHKSIRSANSLAA